MKSYKVYLKEIKLYGHHGVLGEEKERGQNFYIDVEYAYTKDDLKDDLNAALDYSEVYSKVKEIFKAKRYELLENLSQDIGKSLIENFSQIEKVKVKTTKIKPLVGGEVGAVSVSAKEKR
ncbi:MAG: dihydroneopterin aldolase [Actinobacteria bacterium]|nr:MAG: dihydroneopterin aldolase [Actinomycetota bacterium]